jgi:hypothetical protein
MLIRFKCPHCQRVLSVKDNLAGKKGNCPGCKKVVLVPNPASGTKAPRGGAESSETRGNGPLGNGVEPSHADMEAHAAAMLGDKPEDRGVGTTSISFECPFCDEPMDLPLDLAGKRHPCPGCRKIVRVPDLEKRAPRDWQKPEEPAPEGTWGSTNKQAVSQETLKQTGVLPTRRRPRTLGQMALLVGLPVGMLVLLAMGGWTLWGWWVSSQQQQALDSVIAYAESKDKNLERTHQALLHAGLSAYYRQAGDWLKARDHLGKGISRVSRSSGGRGVARDAVLLEILPDFVTLGGKGIEEDDLRRGWGRTQGSLQAGLMALQNPEARRLGLIEVSRRLLAAGEVRRVPVLAGLVYPKPDNPNQADALAHLALILQASGQAQLADQIASPILTAYRQKKRPPLRPHVVALAVALHQEPPAPEKGLAGQENDLLGRSIGLAYRGQFAEARNIANTSSTPQLRLRALVGIGQAAQLHQAGNADLKVALELIQGELSGRLNPRKDSWLVYQLVHLGLQAGLTPEQLWPVLQSFPGQNPAVRGLTQLTLFRAELHATEGIVEENKLQRVEAAPAFQALAHQELARHNVRFDSSWESKVTTWEQPSQTFGTLGVLLGKMTR